MKILLIEDDQLVRDVVIEMLRSLGHSVLAVADARTGLARLADGDAIDVVLTDLKMPDVSGWEVVEVVKAQWPHLPVGIITGSPELLAEQPERVEVVIRKPVRLDALGAALSKLRP